MLVILHLNAIEMGSWRLMRNNHDGVEVEVEGRDGMSRAEPRYQSLPVIRHPATKPPCHLQCPYTCCVAFQALETT